MLNKKQKVIVLMAVLLIVLVTIAYIYGIDMFGYKYDYNYKSKAFYASFAAIILSSFGLILIFQDKKKKDGGDA